MSMIQILCYCFRFCVPCFKFYVSVLGFVVVVVVLFRFVYFDFFVLFLFLSFWAVCLCALLLFSVSSRERKKKKGVVVFKCTVAGRNKTESQILKH